MLSAEENVVLPLKLAGEKPDRDEWVSELTTKVGLSERLSHRPSELSGGQQQRVAIARALVSRPTVMFADEPTGNLDSTTGGEILELLRDSVTMLGQTTVMVTHDAHAAAIADRVLFLDDGLIVKDIPLVVRTRGDRGDGGGDGTMIGVTLRGLFARKIRSFLTALAVVIGISMVSGTYVLTDTFQKAFDSIFTESNAGTDAIVSGRQVLDFSASGRAQVPALLLDQIKELPEVDAATGGLFDLQSNSNPAQLVDADGKKIGGAGGALGVGLDPSDERFTPLRLVDGAWAQGSDEVVIDANTASEHGFAVGDTIGVAALGLVERYEITGVARFGSVDSIGGATFAVFDVQTAQALFQKDGQFDSISVAAKDGVSPEELLRTLQPIVPATAEVKTGAAQAAADSADTNGDLAILTYMLLGFGGVALFVGAFVIFNTMSITVAQRTREFATIRTLGGSRRQVLTSVVLEGFVIGLLASTIGLFLGLGRGKAMNSLFVALGVDLPQAGIVSRNAHRGREPPPGDDGHDHLRHPAGAPCNARPADYRRARRLDASPLAFRAESALRRRRHTRGRRRVARRRALRGRARSVRSADPRRSGRDRTLSWSRPAGTTSREADRLSRRLAGDARGRHGR